MILWIHLHLLSGGSKCSWLIIRFPSYLANLMLYILSLGLVEAVGIYPLGV